MAVRPAVCAGSGRPLGDVRGHDRGQQKKKQ